VVASDETVPEAGSARTAADPRAAAEAGAGLDRGAVVDGSFRIERRLGAGGMAVVYLAHDLRLNRDVALKIHLGPAEHWGPRALREAKVMARLTHPHVLTVHEVGSWEGRIFIAMEYLDGGTLRGWLAARHRDWVEILELFLKAGRGLAAAHDAGLVHRDFKPDNVLLGTDGRLRVADFGLARAIYPAGAATPLEEEPAAAPPVASLAETIPAPASASALTGGSSSSLSAPLTVVGARMGTPAYMSPEARRGGELDARSDQYSFCVALREALSGSRRVPRWLRRALARGLETSPALRFPSMHDLLARLEAGLRRRRRLALSAALLAFAAVVAAGLWLARREGPRACTGSADRLRGAWDAEVAPRVRSALEATGVPGAGKLAAATVAVLDAWAREWAAAHHDACAATRLRGEQPERVLELRMACLERARLQLEATTRLLATADARAADRALEAAGALPAIARCGNTAGLGAVAATPHDPAVAAEVAGLERDLAGTRALFATGRREEGWPQAQALAERARRLHWAPMRGRVLFLLAEYQRDRELPDTAVGTYAEATAAALAGGDDATAAAALAARGCVLGERNRPEEARRELALARAELERLGGDDAVEARVWRCQGQLQVLAGRYDEALAAQRRSVDLLRRRHGAAAWQVGSALVSLAAIELGAGHNDAANSRCVEGLRILEATLGPDHPSTLEAVNKLAAVAERRGAYAEGAAALRRVVDAHTRRWGPDDPRLASSLQNLAMLLRLQGNRAAALAMLERALALAERAPESNAEALGMLLGNMAIVEVEGGRAGRAIDYAVRSRDAFERAFGAEHARLVSPWQVLGTLERSAGRNQESARSLRRALDIAEKRLPADHPERVNAAVELAMTWLALRQPARAVPLLEAGVAMLSRPGANPMNQAEARFALARALWDSGGARARALTLAAAAREGYAALGAGLADPRREVERWIASHR
jgi:tetratricopeptide (TPR) repeat protein